VAWAGLAAAWSLYAPGRALEGDERIARAWPRLRKVLAASLYVDAIYDRLVVKPLWATARTLWRVVDATLIDGLLVNGTAQAVAALGSARYATSGFDAILDTTSLAPGPHLLTVRVVSADGRRLYAPGPPLEFVVGASVGPGSAP